MAGVYLVIEAYVNHDHFSHHADPAGATRVVGVHAVSEPHLEDQESFNTTVKTSLVVAAIAVCSSLLMEFSFLV